MIIDINSIVACPRSLHCRACAANYDYELDQWLLFHLQRRKSKAGDLQDPEHSIRDLPRYRGTLEGSVLPSRQRPWRREGDCEPTSFVGGLWLMISKVGNQKLCGGIYDTTSEHPNVW